MQTGETPALLAFMGLLPRFEPLQCEGEAFRGDDDYRGFIKLIEEGCARLLMRVLA